MKILKLRKNNIEEIEQVAKILYDWWGKNSRISFYYTIYKIEKK